MKFCQEKSIHIISDEVYALSVYDTDSPSAPTFTSVLSIDHNGMIDTGRLHALYGMSKVSSPDASSSLLLSRHYHITVVTRALIIGCGSAGLRLGSLIT